MIRFELFSQYSLALLESEWLIEMSLKSTLICLVALALLVFLRRAESAARHRVVVAALVGLVFLPLANWYAAPLLPNWTVPMLSNPRTQTELAQPLEVANSSLDSRNNRLSISLEETQATKSRVEKAAPFEVLGAAPLLADANIENESEANSGVSNAAVKPNLVRFSLPSFSMVLQILWALGTVWFVLRWIIARCIMGRIVHEARTIDPADEPWKFISETATELGVTSCPRVRLTGNDVGPLVIGILRPTLLLPQQFSSWPRSQQRSIIVHELAHVARRDLLTDLLGRISHAMFWWNPLVWVIRNRQQNEREKACDEHALSWVGLAEDYAQHLVSAVREIGSFSVDPAISMARSSDLHDRVANILDSHNRIGRLRGVSMTMVFGLMAIICVLSPLGIMAIANETDSAVSTNRQVDDEKSREKAIQEAKEAADREAKLQKQFGDRISKLVSAKGIVVDENGAGLAGVEVCLREKAKYRLAELGYFAAIRSGYQRERKDLVIARTKTDGDGKFEFSNVQSTEYRRYKDKLDRWSILIRRPGMAMAWSELDSNENPTAISMTLKPEHPFRGRVVDPSGNPIVGATVYADRIYPAEGELAYFGVPYFEAGKSKLSPWGVTDQQGNFELQGLPSDHRILARVFHNNFLEADHILATTGQANPVKSDRARTGRRAEVTIPAHLSSCQIQLNRGHRIKGQLVDRSGNPLANEKGVLYRKSINQWDRFHTDSEGKFVTECFEQPDAWVCFQGDESTEWMEIYQQVHFAEGEHEKELKIAPRDEGSTFGFVKDNDGTPVPDIGVYFYPTDQAMGRAYSTVYRGKTDAQGRFELPTPEGVPGTLFLARKNEDLTYDLPTQMEVGFGHEHQKRADSMTEKLTPTFDLTGNEHRTVDQPLRVNINKSITFAGKVVDQGGAPLSEPIFELINRNRFKYKYGTSFDFVMPTVKSDMDGQFEIAGIQRRFPPIFKVTNDDSTQTGWFRYLDVKDNPTDCEIKLGSSHQIEGEVTLNGEPISDHPVSLKLYVRFKASKDHWSRGGYAYELDWATTKTDKDGKYKFSAVPPKGEWKIKADRGERDQLELTVGERSFQGTNVVANQDFEFEKLTGTVAGVVVDPQGNPVENARLSAYKLKNPADPFAGRRAYTGRNGLWEPVVTGKDGKFKLDNVPENVKLELSVYYHPTKTGGPGGTSLWHSCASGDQNVKVILDPSLARKPKKRR